MPIEANKTNPNLLLYINKLSPEKSSSLFKIVSGRIRPKA